MIRALVLDVDGVLTDGGIVLHGDGSESKRFHARDGLGIRLAMVAGWRVLFLTARASIPARRRAEELGAEWAIGVGHKHRFLEKWLSQAGIPWEETAYVGDDLHDLHCLRRVGYPVAVADAAREVRAAARILTRLPGGHGAVREAVETLLDAEGLREKVIERFLSSTEGFSVGNAQSSGSGKASR